MFLQKKERVKYPVVNGGMGGGVLSSIDYTGGYRPTLRVNLTRKRVCILLFGESGKEHGFRKEYGNFESYSQFSPSIRHLAYSIMIDQQETG